MKLIRQISAVAFALSVWSLNSGTCLNAADKEDTLPGGSLESGTVSLPFGTVNLNRGMPATADDTKKLYDELDYQFATQAFLWANPLVSFYEWSRAQHELGAADTDLMVYNSYEDKIGILTANTTTPYTMAFFNLRKTGPLVIETPPGPIAGGVGDMWQRTLSDIGETGPDKGKGGKYLILPPGAKPPADLSKDYYVVSFPRYNAMCGFRALAADPAVSQKLIHGIKLYPYAQRANPAPTKLLTPGNKPWYGGPRRGLDYWKAVHAAIQDEVVDERDRFYMAMLRQLGIEDGKQFAPDSRMQEILLKGATAGELIAKANTFAKRFANIGHWPDRRWDYILLIKDTTQRDGEYDQLVERTAYFYEAVTNTNGMISKTPGLGQAYLGTYTDSDGNWFDGAATYHLRVPPNPPAKQFWSVTLYDNDTRCLIPNTTQIADRSSRSQGLKKNADGSIDLYFGPKAPAGFENNWIQTTPGRPWYIYFRLYAPLEAYFDKSWKLPDVEKMK